MSKKYQVTLTIDLVVEVEAEDEEAAEDEVRQLDDAEVWAVAHTIQREYSVSE